MLRREVTFGPGIEVGGVPFSAVPFDRAVEQLISLALTPRAFPVRLSNAYCVAIAKRDPAYQALLAADGATLPDGSPIAWVMRRLAGRYDVSPSEVHLIRGPSFFTAVLERSAGTGVRHYFLGGSQQTIDSLVATVRAQHPGIGVAGAHSPAFGPVDDAFVADSVRRVRASGANLVWVALGTPKQDFAASRLADVLDLPVAAVGAAFDFTAGTVRSAPRALQGRGLEWLFRLAQDPQRLWRRYAAGNTRFLLVAGRDLLHSRR